MEKEWPIRHVSYKNVGFSRSLSILRFPFIEPTIALYVIDVKLISHYPAIFFFFLHHCGNAINRLSFYEFQNCTMTFMHSDKSPTGKKMSIFLSWAILPKPLARFILPGIVCRRSYKRLPVFCSIVVPLVSRLFIFLPLLCVKVVT